MEWTVEEADAFAGYLKEARQRVGYTVQQAAEASGVSTNTIYVLERGPMTGMRFIDLARLAHCYGLDLNEVAKVAAIVKDGTAQIATSPTRKSSPNQ